MEDCLYRCGSNAPSTQVYHVYPQSASNLQTILEMGVVCDKCNLYFSKLENYFIHYQPGASAKLMALRQTKKGKQPTYQSDAGLATRTLDDGKFTLSIPLSNVTSEITEEGNIIIKGVAKGRSFDAKKISRLLGKIAMEYAYTRTSFGGMNLDPFSADYDPLRRYVRFGDGPLKFAWFMYKDVQGEEAIPEIVRVEDGDTLLGSAVLIRLPGIHYVFPLPPIMGTDFLQKAAAEWTFVEAAGSHPSKDLDVLVPLIRRTQDGATQSGQSSQG